MKLTLKLIALEVWDFVKLAAVPFLMVLAGLAMIFAVSAYGQAPTGNVYPFNGSVTSGGTGTTTQFTQGSVVYAGANGVYSQDNATLFWDLTNKRLGIGTVSPSTPLHLFRNSAGAVATFQNLNSGTWGTFNFDSAVSGAMEIIVQNTAQSVFLPLWLQPTGGTLWVGAGCNSAAAPAVCGAAPAGSVVVAAVATTVVVNTTAVTANSQILLTFDSSLGARLGVTCNTTVPTVYSVSARTAATSFTLTATAPAVNPACFSYMVIN